MTQARRRRTLSSSPTHDVPRSNGRCKRTLDLLNAFSVISFLQSLTCALFQYRRLTRQHIGGLASPLESRLNCHSDEGRQDHHCAAIVDPPSLPPSVGSHVHDEVIKRRRCRSRQSRRSARRTPAARRPVDRATERQADGKRSSGCRPRRR